MEQHVFLYSFIIEGATEKVLQLIMLLKLIYNKNLGFVETKKCILEHYSEVQTIINLLMNTYCHEKKFWWPFQSCHLSAYVSISQRCAVPLVKWRNISVSCRVFFQNTFTWWNGFLRFTRLTSRIRKSCRNFNSPVKFSTGDRFFIGWPVFNSLFFPG